MKTGTKISGQFLVDSRFLKNCDPETGIAVQRSSFKTAIHGEGIELYTLGEERPLNWPDGDKQIRQDFTLILSKPLSKDKIYEIVNQVRPQQLKFH